jgi:hypothetical protein
MVDIYVWLFWPVCRTTTEEDAQKGKTTTPGLDITCILDSALPYAPVCCRKCSALVGSRQAPHSDAKPTQPAQASHSETYSPSVTPRLANRSQLATG